MNKINIYHILLITILLLAGSSFYAHGQGQFYKEYWAEFDSTVTLTNLKYWRVNDEQVSLHERHGPRKEIKANGLFLIPV